jgi:hypothetical protein
MQITVTYPESWAEIKLEQYLRFYRATKPYENTDQYDEEALEAGALHFCKVPAEYLYKLPASKLNKIRQTIYDLLAKTNDLPLIKTFGNEDTTYGFIPELDEMTYGEYLDLVNYTSKDMWKNIPIIMTILYRPLNKTLGSTYTIHPYNGTDDDRIELFSHNLTMDIVWGAIGFFFHLQKDLLTATLTYSLENLKKEKILSPETIQVLETSIKNGLDITQLQSLQTMTLPNLTK